jgi:hypothetical protein
MAISAWAAAGQPDSATVALPGSLSGSRPAWKGIVMDYGQTMEWQRGTMAERVAADLASQIANGKLSKWDSLPLNRTLANQWNVSERTVS